MNHSSPSPTRRIGRRRLSIVAAAVAASLALAACTGGGDEPTPNPTDTNVVTTEPSVDPSASGSGSASPSVAPSTISNLDALDVSGAFGAEPAVTASWPLAIAETQVKVLSEGAGPEVAEGGTVLVNYTGINARDGKSFDSSWVDGVATPVAFPLDQVIAGFRIGLEGQKIGSRVVIMMTPADGYAEGNPGAGILATDSLVFVVDIVSAQLDEPFGTAVTPPAGLPTVTDNGKGNAPTITIGSDVTKPTELVVQPLITGTGPAVKDTDGIVVNYTSVGWNGEVLAQNYTTGPETGMLNTLIPGWQKGLVNQPVGSRVLLIVPPADAYPKGNATPSIPAGETLVYVVDILFASASG
ncbi:FKBP-type peptidyl-prolyl cis-trans isomerase [Propionibacteriaceae bacterium Y1923]|uniref:FKBP-type peptidyl-prolyl cis-trans isomerase n=1 Tax=Aestuariimicrobium sp. Y1814 TaxID=3418742 RepID=UPI003C197571